MERLEFREPVTHVYNPLVYARIPNRKYLQRYGKPKKNVLLIGMNPGPFGMAQTGVPFGEIAFVRDWLGIDGAVNKPKNEHPKRPIQGFDCPRSEVSGARLWGWAKSRYKTPDRFFKRYFVWNYCPLAFMEASGKNRTPDKLPVAERVALFTVCDEALKGVVNYLRPKYLLGVGKFAEDRIRSAFDEADYLIGRIPHPSPASPAANKGWAPLAERALTEIGVKL